jgi:hypothetical protein
VTVRIERGTEIQAACGQLRLADGSGRASRWTPADRLPADSPATMKSKPAPLPGGIPVPAAGGARAGGPPAGGLAGHSEIKARRGEGRA